MSKKSPCGVDTIRYGAPRIATDNHERIATDNHEQISNPTAIFKNRDGL